MFDWGAQAVTAILDSGLYEALEKIQQRPWLYDGLEKWLEKLQVKKSLKIVPQSLCFVLYFICLGQQAVAQDKTDKCERDFVLSGLPKNKPLHILWML